MARGEIWLTIVLSVCLVSGAAFRGVQLRNANINPYIVDDQDFTIEAASVHVPISEEANRTAKETPEWPLDINLATPEQLEEVRGIGPSLSAEIVSYRKVHGPFLSMEDLLAVPGIGAARLTALKQLFEVRPGPGIEEADRHFPLDEDIESLGAFRLFTPESSTASGRVNINRATREELESLPKIGPVLAGRILQDREKNGPFRTESDIMRVSGIGPATYEAIARRITVRP